MLIRCTRCQAVFSLQDGVAGVASNFKVECGRCALVFDATAPARAEQPPQTPATPAPRANDPGALERRANADELAKALRPRRPGDPPPSAPKKSPIWIVALGGLVLLGVGFLVTRAHLGGLSREAQARMEKGREKLLRDDSASLAQATALFTEAARLAPGEAAPEGERAYALLLQAATHKDLSARIETLLKEQPNIPEADKLVVERDEHARAATRRLQEGLAAARAALEDDGADPVALRAEALHAALTGAPDKGAQPILQAERLAPKDPWNAYTRALLALSGPPARENQDRALSALAIARQAAPHMLRAQVEVAAISVDRGEAGPARLGLNQILQENPAHDRAKRLLSLLPPAP